VRAAPTLAGQGCPHRPPCPGCPRWGEPGLAPKGLWELAALCAASGAAGPTVVTGPALGHRHRARLMVRGRAAAPEIGLFEAGSHRIVDVPRCGVHHPRINQVAAALRRAIRATGTQPYAERPHAGLLRAVQVAVERASGRAQVALVARSEDPHSLDALAHALLAELGEALQGLFWNGNPGRTNAILGPRFRRIAGEPMLCERIAGAEVFFPPGAFGQSNLPLFERIALRVAGFVPEGARVVEFHAGCGALGLSLVARAAVLVMNEREPAALEGLARGLAALPAPLRARIEVAPGPAAEHANRVADADCVIVDPPRRGLDPELLATLCAAPPRSLVYVSCALAPFLREARALGEAGLVPVAIDAFALFPFTEHVETVAHFERRFA
jgi:23S rRNA (uracil1939-C5)-methyltransferase